MKVFLATMSMLCLFGCPSLPEPYSGVPEDCIATAKPFILEDEMSEALSCYSEVRIYINQGRTESPDLVEENCYQIGLMFTAEEINRVMQCIIRNEALIPTNEN